MKRLLDEDDPNDEIVRLLIRAGAEHQPPRSGKMRLVAALGLGSAIGLSASEALAWIGTSSGKVALAVAVVGVAAGGTFLAAAPRAPSAAFAPDVVLAARAPAELAPLVRPARPALAASPEALASSDALVSPEAPAASPGASAPPLRVSVADEPATGDEPSQTSEPPRAGERAAKAERRRARARTPRARDARGAPATARAEAARSAAGDGAASSALSEETIWVDRLRVAAERQDRRSFERLRGEYDERFPEGQLHPEVERLNTLLR